MDNVKCQDGSTHAFSTAGFYRLIIIIIIIIIISVLPIKGIKIKKILITIK